MKKPRRKRSLVTPLGAELTATVREMGRRQRFIHTEIWARWLAIVGSETYKRSFPKSFRGTTLIVGVANSTWMQELSFLERSLLDRLEEEVGAGVVKKIRFVLDTAVGKHRPPIIVRRSGDNFNTRQSRTSQLLGKPDEPISKDDLMKTVRRAFDAFKNTRKTQH